MLSALLLLLLFFAAVERRSLAAREVRVLNIGWLSNGNSTIKVDVPSFTSSLWVPLAVKHFNERSNAVLPLTDLVDPACDATLTLVGGVHNDDGSAKQAMFEFIGSSSLVDVVLGPVLSITTVPVAVATAAMDLPQISFAATADELSNKLQYPTFFRIGPTDAQSGQATCLLFQQYGYKKVGLISVNNEFGLAIKTALQAECRTLGIEVFVEETEDVLGQALQQQTYAALENMKTLRLNVIVFATKQFEFIYWLGEAARQLDWMIGKLYISHVQLNDYGTMTPAQIKQTYLFLNGSLDIEANANLKNPRFLNLLQVWPTFNVSDLNPYLPAKFRVPDNYFTLGQEKLAGRGWAWAYDSVITLGLAACGKSTSLKSNLLDVSFAGTSGWVSFVRETQDRNPDAFYYTVTNLLVNADVTVGSQPIVGDLQGGETNWNFTKTIGYNTGTTTPPKDTDPPENVIDRIPFGAKVYGWVGTSIALLSSLIAFSYIIKHRKQRIIVESQPTYLGLLAIGCGLIAGSIIALTIESDAGCMGFPWLFSSGLTLAMASLTVKSARIAIYWRHRGEISTFKRILGTRLLPAGLWLIVLVDLAILLAWQLTAPWVLQMVVLGADDFGNPLRSSLVCTSSSYSATIFIGVLVGYMILIALITGWVSFWVRNAPRRYHEAKMTALAGVSMFQVFLMAAPAAYAVWQMALPRFLVLSSMSFLLCMIILCTMFIPKMFKVRFLGKMAAKTAAVKKKDANAKTVTFGTKTEHIAPNDNADEAITADDQERPNYSARFLNFAPPKPTADWKLMILGIRSENDYGTSDSESPPSHDHSDTESPPEHETGQNFSPPEHERIAQSISPPGTVGGKMIGSPVDAYGANSVPQTGTNNASNDTSNVVNLI